MDNPAFARYFEERGFLAMAGVTFVLLVSACIAVPLVAVALAVQHAAFHVRGMVRG